MQYTPVSGLKKLRWSALILGISNVIVIGLDLVFIIEGYPACAREDFAPFFIVLIVSCLRILAMTRIGMAQQASANIILNLPEQSTPGHDSAIRLEKRMRYRRWHWWTWFSAVITLLQSLGAVYLLCSIGNLFHTSTNCVSGVLSDGYKWKHYLLILFMIMVSYVALVQWFVGSDVLRWRSFYAAEDDAWKAHYREVFDHGIREALCCLGRIKYLSDSKEDEIYSLAKLLGDLVAYRASGTGHLEFLAGLALLKRHCLSPKLYEASSEVPEDRIQEAVNLHLFAEAAYTGLLLDVGRNPVLFPCAWVYRQGILTPWARHRWPLLEGDNWWRGHAAAFLNYTNLPPEVLRRGRVNQEKCKAAYFIVVLHHLKSVVIAVRGTETPEDLITDGLGRECTLTVEDLDGLINGSNIQPGVRHKVISSLPHYGHSGIVEAARDLYMQIEGNYKEDESQDGFLSSLLSYGSECDGYSLRIVGHSLGGAIGAVVAIRLYRRYPNLHVYTYGPLPCLDSVIAEACSDFVTSIVHNNEFSARLSVASILRLRADAMMALSQDATTDSTMIYQLARRFLFLSKHQQNDNNGKPLASDLSSISMNIEGTHSHGSRTKDIELSVWRDVGLVDNPHDAGCSHCSCSNPFCDPSANVNIFDAPVTQIMETVPLCRRVSSGCIPEMFLPGVVIHIVPQKNSIHMPLWKFWISGEKACSYRAYIAKREAFKDIVVSTHMFLDHLPWRCNYAMKKVLEKQNPQILLDRSQMV